MKNTPAETELWISPALRKKTAETAANDVDRLLNSVETSVESTGKTPGRTLSACHSLRGRREKNQDVAFTCRMRVQGLGPIDIAAVCDGMGGGPSGEVAACETARGVLAALELQMFRAAKGDGGFGVAAWLGSSADAANQWVLEHIRSRSELAGMGSTLCMALTAGGHLYTVNAGDSRAYLCRGGQPFQLTDDDSYPNLLVQQGLLASEDMEDHPDSNILTRFVGDGKTWKPAPIGIHALEPGDAVLTVTDGVWKDGRADVDWFAKTIVEAKFEPGALDDIVQRLLQRALDRGADDNVSAAAIWTEPPVSNNERQFDGSQSDNQKEG